MHGCRRCLGKELLLPSMALIGSARSGNQDLVLSLSTKAKKNAGKYADEVIVLSKGVQDYFKETYGRENALYPEWRE